MPTQDRLSHFGPAVPTSSGVRARIATGSAGALGVVALAFSSGGYFPSEWGLVTLAFLLCILAVLVVSDEIEIGRPAAIMLAALALLGLWQLASALWSVGAGPPVIEAERTLLYLSSAAAFLVCLRPATVPALFEGIVAGVTLVAVYALGTRLAPGRLGGIYDPSSGYQLAKPIEYWNALGLLVVFGLVLAAGIAQQRGGLRAALAGAAAVPLLTCLYFTFSRGSVVALVAGLAVVVFLDGDRLRASLLLGAFLAVPLGAVALAGRSRSLTTAGATLQTAQREGHRLAWQLAALTLLTAAVHVVVARAAPRIRFGPSLRRRLTAAVVTLVVILGVAGLVRAGGPGKIFDRTRAAFVEEPPATAEGLERRLLSASGNGRSAYWRVAARMVERDPLLGGGAGSFGRAWTKERPVANEARDAHNLYLETLAEVGPAGLSLLLVVLVAPLTAVRRVRHHPNVPAATGVLAAFLLHAGVDWDWEIPLLTIVALSSGAVLLVVDPGRRAVVLTPRRRGAMLAVAGAALVVALPVHVGNRAAADALDALAADRPAEAAAAAERARTWIPWSSEGDQLLGEARAEGGDDEGARAALRSAARKDPGEWSIWYDLAAVATGPERVRALTLSRDLNPLSVELAGLTADTR